MHTVNNAQSPIDKDTSDVMCFTKAGLNTYAILKRLDLARKFNASVHLRKNNSFDAIKPPENIIS